METLAAEERQDRSALQLAAVRLCGGAFVVPGGTTNRQRCGAPAMDRQKMCEYSRQAHQAQQCRASEGCSAACMALLAATHVCAGYRGMQTGRSCCIPPSRCRI